jgi:hypothetical protein
MPTNDPAPNAPLVVDLCIYRYDTLTGELCLIQRCPDGSFCPPLSKADADAEAEAEDAEADSENAEADLEDAEALCDPVTAAGIHVHFKNTPTLWLYPQTQQGEQTRPAQLLYYPTLTSAQPTTRNLNNVTDPPSARLPVPTTGTWHVHAYRESDEYRYVLIECNCVEAKPHSGLHLSKPPIDHP